jgi:hypothetical protein
MSRGIVRPLLNADTRKTVEFLEFYKAAMYVAGQTSLQ